MSMNPRKLTILLAEDDDGHATLFRRNLQRTRIEAEVLRMRNGQEILDYLGQPPTEKTRAVPTLVLLDISMPKVDGIEVLRRIKANPETRTLPVYMLTTTDNPLEIERCFELGCNAYVTKPIAYDAFIKAIERLCGFLEITQLPGITPIIRNVSA
jgi:CheY-like chemotaxis protein